ncbi:MAG: hypothetical protein QG622_221 [Actinomycetota bacterium]|nr:hypothetical protein [Actinomycetota bacterium]
MDTYVVDLESVLAGFPAGTAVPSRLQGFGPWFAGIRRGALGHVDALAGEPFSSGLSDDGVTTAMRERLGVFLLLGDGSRVALWDHGAGTPAVVLLGSENEARNLAPDLDTFLARWSAGATGVRDLDDYEGASGFEAQAAREGLARWLAHNGAHAADAEASVDVTAWVDGLVADGRAGRDAKLAALAALDAVELPQPVLRNLIDRAGALFGALTDSDEMRDFGKDLGIDLEDVPGPDEFRSLTWRRHGFALEFAWPWEYPNLRLATRYPPADRPALENRRARMLWGITLHADGDRERGIRPGELVDFSGFTGALPAGVTFADDRDALLDRLGPPREDATSALLGDTLTWFDPGSDVTLAVALSPGGSGPYALPLSPGTIRSVRLRVRSGFEP